MHGIPHLTGIQTMTTRVLSFDCGTKRLGVSCFDYDRSWIGRYTTILNTAPWGEINQSTSQPGNTTIEVMKWMGAVCDAATDAIKPVLLQTIDVIPGKKVRDVGDVELATQLHNTLVDIDDDCRIAPKCSQVCYQQSPCRPLTPADEHDVVVLVEQQPIKINNACAIICGQIMLHYISKGVSVMSIHTSKKNKVGDEEHEPIFRSIKQYGGYASSYSRNKAHCRDNFRIWAKLWGVDISRVGPINDVSDAFMQSVAWLTLSSVRTRPRKRR